MVSRTRGCIVADVVALEEPAQVWASADVHSWTSADVHSAVPVTPRSIGHAAACDERMGDPARKHAGLTQRGTCLVTPGHRARHGHDRARTKHRAAAAVLPREASKQAHPST